MNLLFKALLSILSFFLLNSSLQFYFVFFFAFSFSKNKSYKIQIIKSLVSKTVFFFYLIFILKNQKFIIKCF